MDVKRELGVGSRDDSVLDRKFWIVSNLEHKSENHHTRVKDLSHNRIEAQCLVDYSGVNAQLSARIQPSSSRKHEREPVHILVGL